MKRILDTPRTEAELCDVFAERARACGWDIYPECGGWDLLLVWTGKAPPPVWARLGLDVAPGFQIGVEAKLRGSLEVLEQASSRMECPRGAPDVGAVLVPAMPRCFSTIAKRLGLRAFTLVSEPVLPIGPEPREARPSRGRVALPPIALQGSGGQASPRVLSPWRVSALRLVIELRKKGSLTRAEGKALGIDLSHWVQRGWVATDGGRPARYTEFAEKLSTGPTAGYERELELLAVTPTTSIEVSRGAA